MGAAGAAFGVVTRDPRPSRGGSVRRLLLLSTGGVVLCVAALGVAVNVVFIPRIRSLRTDTEHLLGQIQGFVSHTASLDTAVAAARREVAAGDTGAAHEIVVQAEVVKPTSLTAAARNAMIGAPLEMRASLATALDDESQLADLLSEAGALFALGRPAQAALTLREADSVVAQLGTALAAAQRAGLRDVARRGTAFEALAEEVSRTLLWLAVIGILAILLAASVVHRRLYAPLRRLDVGLREVSAGSLVTRVEVPHDDEMGRLAALFNRMVGELRQREEERASEHQRMTWRILEATLDGVVTTTPEGRITGWNPGAETIFGWSADEVMGKSLGEVIYPPTERELHARRLELLRAGRMDDLGPRRLQVTAVRRDGRSFTAEESIVPILEGGEVVAVAGFVRDLTETLELQEQVRRSQRLEAVGRLAGGIAHDFNNLISVILGQSQLALEQTHDSETTRGLREVERAANRAAELTAQLLAFARRQVVSPRVVAVNDLVTETLGMVKRVIESSVRMVPALDPDAGLVNVDPGHFSQVLLNLIMNARDALGTRGGTVEITTGVTHVGESDHPLEIAAGEYVRIAVVDDGPGIPEAVKDRVFDPFFSTKPQGTGLGLATCHGIVRQAGGTMTARNLEGKGAEFTVYLPRVPSPTSSPAPVL
jgi:PAS domain S-box-containing protein